MFNIFPYIRKKYKKISGQYDSNPFWLTPLFFLILLVAVTTYILVGGGVLFGIWKLIGAFQPALPELEYTYSIMLFGISILIQEFLSPTQ